MVSNPPAFPFLEASDSSENTNSGRGNITPEPKSKKGFMEWKWRVSKKAIQRMGLATVVHDENTGNIDIPLKNFELLKSRLNDVQKHIENYIQSMESTFVAFQACLGTEFLHNPLRDDDMARQIKQVMCNGSVQGMVVRRLNEFLLEPLKVVFEFCNTIDEMLKHRTSLLYDYDYYKRKFGSASHRKSNRKVQYADDGQRKLESSIECLRQCTSEFEAQLVALEKVEPQLQEWLYKSLAAIQMFYCQASLAAFDDDQRASEEIMYYVRSMHDAVNHCETQNTRSACPLLSSWSPLKKITAEIHAHLDAARVIAPLGAVFGVPLALQNSLPHILVESVWFLDNYGLYQSGLFRVPGNNESIADLKRQFDMGDQVVFNITDHNVHDVAGLLKKYFREQPEPVVPLSSYVTLLDAGSKHVDEFIRAASKEIQKFPPINADCLCLLFAFLHRVSEMSKHNKMTSENLGIVFAPNLLRPANSSEISVMDLQPCINVITKLIDHACDVFDDVWKNFPTTPSEL